MQTLLLRKLKYKKIEKALHSENTYFRKKKCT